MSDSQPESTAPVEPVSDQDKIVSWNWVLRSIENNPDHAVIISRTPEGLCFTHGNPVPELEDANELLRDALKELVDCKDLAIKIAAEEGTDAELDALETEYEERKPAAWALARAVLKDTKMPSMFALPPGAVKIFSYAPTTGDHTYELSSGNRITYTLEQAIALGYPIAAQFKGQRFSVVIDPDELAALRKDQDSLMAMCTLLARCRKEKEELKSELAAIIKEQPNRGR